MNIFQSDYESLEKQKQWKIQYLNFCQIFTVGCGLMSSEISSRDIWEENSYSKINFHTTATNSTRIQMF